MGTAGNDTFTGSVTGSTTTETYNNADVIIDNSSTDSDTLNIASNGTVSNKPKVSGVEKVNFNVTSFTDATLDATAISGATITANNLQTGGATGAVVSIDTANAGNTVAAGSNVTTLTVGAGNVGKNSVTINGNDATTINVGSNDVTLATGEQLTATINTTKATSINAEGTSAKDSLTVNATGNVSVDTDGATADQIETLTVSGNGAAVVATVAGAPTTIIATGSQDVTVKVGGDDIDGKTFTDSTTAGTTTLEVSTAAATGNLDVALSKVAADVILLSSDVVDTATDTITVKTGAKLNVTSTQTGLLTADSATATTNSVTVTTVTKSGALSTDKYTLGGFTNFKTVNLIANEDTDVSAFGATTDVVITGSEKVTLGSAVAKTVDASGATGVISATMSSNLLDLKTGSGKDSVSVLTDVDFKLSMGDGTDTLTLLAGTDFSNNTGVSISGADVLIAKAEAAGTTNSVLTLGSAQTDATNWVVKGEETAANDIDSVKVLMTGSTVNLSGWTVDSTTISQVTIDGANGTGSGATDSQTITGTGIKDVITLNGQSGTINAGKGNDTLTGGAGNDTLNGEDGNDTIDGGSGNDIINAGEGDDYIVGNSGNDTVDAGAGNDEAQGGDGIDTLNGLAGADKLNGGASADVINGGDDADFIVGGASADTLSGGAGIDTFAYATGGVLTVTETTAGSVGVKSVDSLVISGTYMAGEILTVNDGTNSITYTVKFGDTNDTIASGIVTAINAGTYLFDASVSGSTITLTETATGDADLDNTATVSTVVAAISDTAVSVSGTTVSGYDKISDFSSSEDKLLIGSQTIAGSATAAPTAGTNVQISATGGKATFNSADDTLAEIISTLTADTTNVGNDEVVVFELSGNTYVYGAGGTAGGTTDFMVELTGVTGLGTASITDGYLTFA